MQSDHLIFQAARISFPCKAGCGSWEATHVVDEPHGAEGHVYGEMYCQRCCTICNVETLPLKDWGDNQEPVTGEQSPLF